MRDASGPFQPTELRRAATVRHATVLLGLVLALACAAGASLAGLWKQKGAVHCQSVDIRRPIESAPALFRSKWFLIGWLAAVVAWLLHIGALALELSDGSPGPRNRLGP